MRLILVRHGETESNSKGIYMGRTDLPLNEAGRRQASAAAKRLSAEHIDAIYSSPLKRAHETAEQIAVPHTLPVQLDGRLIEQDFGLLEGKPSGSVATQAKAAGIPYYTYNGHQGESLEMVRNRAVPALDEIYHLYKGKTVVVVAHGAFLRAVLLHLLRFPSDDIEELKLKNASITILDLDDSGNHKAHVIGSIEHLS